VEKRKQTDEVQDAQALAKRTTGKPLFEQLAEQQQKKQEEYDAVTKLIFCATIIALTHVSHKQHAGIE
jgi:hypothetical protein